MPRNKIVLILMLLALSISGCIYEHSYDITNPNSTITAEIATNQATPIITPETAYEIKEYYVIENGTRMYQDADNNSQLISVLYSGDIVELVDEENEYFYVEYSTFSGYINLTDLTVIPTEPKTIDINNYDFVSPYIVVIKSLHILELWDSNTLILTCTVQIGQNEDGDKQILGDKKTPEGEYYISTLNPGSKYYMGMYISYPNAEDATLAYENDIIDESTKESIVSATSTLAQPPFDTPLGGFISIHGDPNKEGYTAGCMAIQNEFMDILWEQCPVGTKVIILP